MLGTAGAALASFALLFVVFLPLERSFPARPDQKAIRPAFFVDACFFFGQYLLWSGIAAGALVIAQKHTGTLAPASIASLFSRLPLWVSLAVGVVMGDVLVYWFHRACHRFGWLWRFHAVHHSAEHLDWLAAHREHPVDGVLTQLCQNLPLFVLGVPVEMLAGLAVFRGAWGVFIHSNVRLPLGPLRFVLGAPELHHFHHARLERTEHTFANLAPWLDVVFGTYHRPEPGPERYPLGLNEPWPKSYLGQLVRPFLPAPRSALQAKSSLNPETIASSATAPSATTAT
jgi:sterol desaturase/sphingolipid hydroxylase (fatty acid hydroxylase superfamily)